MQPDFALKFLIFSPIISFPLIYLISRITLLTTTKKGRPINPSRWLALGVLFVQLLPLSFAIKQFINSGAVYTTIGTIQLQMDGISVLLTTVVILMSLLIILFSGDYMGGEVGEEKYYAMLVGMVGLVIGLSTASDLFNLWVWFEAMAITPYVLVAFYHDQAPVLEAGVKYLIQSAVGTMLVLLGIMIVFMQTGTLNMPHISGMNIQNNPALVVAGILFIIGFGVKSALVPMHTWLPDAHSQAPSGISALLSGVVIEAGLITMIRTLDMVSGAFPQAGTILIVISALNILVGNLLALRQTQIKRMLAFSSIAHMGYIVLGIGITMTSGVLNGAQGAFFHIFNHAIMKGLAFMSIGVLMYALTATKKDSHDPLTLDDMNGVAKRFPLLGICLSIGLLSLAGIPPLAGFVSKWQIFIAGFETHDPFIIGVVIFAAINGVISIAYYAPIINRMYRLTPSPHIMKAKSITPSMKIVLSILTIATVIIGGYPTLLNWLTEPAANVILTAFLPG